MHAAADGHVGFQDERKLTQQALSADWRMGDEDSSFRRVVHLLVRYRRQSTDPLSCVHKFSNLQSRLPDRTLPSSNRGQTLSLLRQYVHISITNRYRLDVSYLSAAETLTHPVHDESTTETEQTQTESSDVDHS